MSRNRREGRYIGYATLARCCQRGHIRSKWHGNIDAPFASLAFGVVKTRRDQCR